MIFKSVAIGAIALVAASAPALASTELIIDGNFEQLTNGYGQLNEGYTSAIGWSTTGYNFVMHSGTDGAYSNQFQKTAYLWDAANMGTANNPQPNTWNGLTESGVGNFAALDGDLDGPTITEPLTQTVNGLVVGRAYTLSFNYAFAQQYGSNQSVAEDLTVGFGGVSITTLPSAFTDCDRNGNNCTGGYLNPEHGFSGWATYTATFIANSSSEVLSFLASGSKEVPPFVLISDVSLIDPPPVPEPATWVLMGLGFAGLGFLGLRAKRRRAAATIG